MTRRSTIMLASLAIAAAAAASAADCPPAVKAAVVKAHPDAEIQGCQEETNEGRVQYVVKLSSKNGAKLELDVSTEGEILLTEERVPLDVVPPAVLAALTARHADARPLRADKQTTPDGKVTYEIGFLVGNRKMDATFAADGTFLEEE